MFLINSAKNNSSKQQLNDICEKYYLDIYRYCAARLDRSYAGDITNEVFKVFCQKWRNLKNKNYRSWLYETADNLVKNFYKKNKRKIEKEMYINESMTGSLSYEQNFETIFDDINEEEIERYKNVILDNLSNQEQQLFNMRYIKKLSIAQISKKLSISENNVKQRLFRIREKIKTEVHKILK